MRRKRKYSVILLHVFLFGVLVAGCGSTHRVRLDGHSMEPNFHGGEIFFVYPIAAHDIKRGDLVYFQLDNDRQYIKRVVGLPNEDVEVQNGHVIINGAPLEEPYKTSAPSYTTTLVLLKANQYFVLGDNRDQSDDSHEYGPITYDQIIGIAVPW